MENNISVAATENPPVKALCSCGSVSNATSVWPASGAAHSGESDGGATNFSIKKKKSLSGEPSLDPLPQSSTVFRWITRPVRLAVYVSPCWCSWYGDELNRRFSSTSADTMSATGMLTIAVTLLSIVVPSASCHGKAEHSQRGRQQELEVVSRILSVFAKQEKDPCIPRGRILAIIRTEKTRYSTNLSIIMVFISNLVLMFNLFVMVVTRYLRYDIRNSIGQLLREAANEDNISLLPSSFY